MKMLPIRVTMARSKHDVLACMAFPASTASRCTATNPIKRLNREMKRRADVAGIIPNKSMMRLTGAVPFERNDGWQTSSRCMMVEALARIDKKIDPILSIPTKAA